MALLTDPERAACTAAYMVEKSGLRENLPSITKADLRAAINAVDQWCEDNTSSFNSAIPLPARTALSTQQKADLLLYVVRRRTRGN